MDNVPKEPVDQNESRHQTRDGRLVYVMPAGVLRPDGDDQIDLLRLWRTLWQGKWLIAGITGFIVALCLAYALFATEWYRADVLLTPAEAKSTQGLADQLSGLGSLSGLASLAGITIGGADTAEPLAVLTSRDFTRAFIVEQDLLPVLFVDDWDAKTGRWKATDPQDQPDIYDAVKYFDEDIRRVKEDKKTKLVTVTIEWTEPQVAAEWANLLVKRLNDRMRQRSLQEAESNVSYLKRELADANIVTLQQSVGRLLESELQKAMLARVNEEFAFRIIDRAEAPKWRSRPKRALIMGFGVIAGVLLSSLIVLVRNAIRQNRANGGNRADLGVTQHLR